MEAAMIVHFGGAIPGREKFAVETFAETTKLYEKRLADGTFTYFEPFLYKTGDVQEHLGFWIVKGTEEKLLKFIDSREATELAARAGQICNHLSVEFLYCGEGVREQITMRTRLAEELLPV